jgi:DnaJ family protein B protein 4
MVGWTRRVRTIDGNYVNVIARTPTGPDWSEVYPELGMPSPKDATVRGDLIVGVTVKYPRVLSAWQKESLYMAFREST